MESTTSCVPQLPPLCKKERIICLSASLRGRSTGPCRRSASLTVIKGMECESVSQPVSKNNRPSSVIVKNVTFFFTTSSSLKSRYSQRSYFICRNYDNHCTIFRGKMKIEIKSISLFILNPSGIILNLPPV